MHRELNFVATGIAFAALGMLPNLASAALGEPEASAQGDSETLKGSIKSSERGAYHVHEIQLPSGTIVREYAIAGGQVFAIVWNGPSMPNLKQTLGRYFDAYVDEQSRSRSRTHLRIEHSDFVAFVSGHMRAFTGRAYLPQALPAGVNIGELR